MSQDPKDAIILLKALLWSKEIILVLGKKHIGPGQLVISAPFILAAYAHTKKIQDVQGFAQAIKDGILLCYEMMQEGMEELKK